MIRTFCESAVVYAAACWGSSLRVADANRLFTLTDLPSLFIIFFYTCVFQSAAVNCVDQ